MPFDGRRVVDVDEAQQWETVPSSVIVVGGGTAGLRTAIRMAAEDGNDATAPDPDWQPFLDTPPLPDYPSTHSALGAAAATVLASVYGDDTEFSFASGTAVPGVRPGLAPTKPGAPAGATRSFKSFSQAAKENASSRVIIGIHFRFACNAGLDLGNKVGAWVTVIQGCIFVLGVLLFREGIVGVLSRWVKKPL